MGQDKDQQMRFSFVTVTLAITLGAVTLFVDDTTSSPASLQPDRSAAGDDARPVSGRALGDRANSGGEDAESWTRGLDGIVRITP
jgi:hypothetical protein